MRKYSFRGLGTAFILTFLSSSAGAQDVARGQTVFQRCSACHSSTVNAPAGIGPNLAGVVGRKAGSVPKFDYSSAMKTAGFSWTTQKLDAFLTKPSALVPGTRMPFAGIADPKDRRDVIAYLSGLKAK